MTAAITRDDLLLAHAAGTLAPPLDLLVSAHLRMRPEARRDYRLLLEIGGILFEQLEPEAVSEDALTRLLARLDGGEALRDPGRHDGDRALSSPLPEALACCLREPMARLSALASSPVAWVPLQLPQAGCRLMGRLVRIRCGHALERHRHRGLELTLVLEGAYVDETGCYRRGDIEVCDESIEHAPRAEGSCDCLCLSVAVEAT